MSNMNSNDAIEARLTEAAEQLVASFSHLDTEAELHAVRDGSLPASWSYENHRRPRWVAAAAAVVLLAGGVAVAAAVAMRSGNDSTPSITPTPDSTPAVMATTSATTEPLLPVVPVTTVPTAPVPDTAMPGVGAPSDVFVTVSLSNSAVIEVRNAIGVAASVDLSCPQDLDCVVESARVMGDTIWVAINDTQPGLPDAVVGSRVVSVTRSTGAVDEHLSLDGFAARSAGLGANGVLYAYLDGRTPAERQLVAIEDGEVRELEIGVSGFRLSDDGRFLAVAFSKPSAGEPTRFEVTNLVDQTTNQFQTPSINAGPAAWSPDGRYLIVDEQWEDQTAWVVDPWSGSSDPIPETVGLLDGACFMSNDVVAHRTWNVGYGQGDARPGVIRLRSLDTGSTVAEIGGGLFGDGFRCHPDGSVSYLRRPVVEVQLSADFSQLEPDYNAPVELVHLTPDGTASVTASGDLRLV
jgi:hypothetical protein